MIDDACMIGQHEKVILQFSGGKDSSAVLMLARPYLDRITVMFTDTGGNFLHVTQYVQSMCEQLGAKLQVVRPRLSLEENFKTFGRPSDIVPVESAGYMAPFLRDVQGQRLQSYLDCCYRMILGPMQEAVKESGATLVLRGAKYADRRRGVPPGTVFEGITYDAPIWNWSDEDVFRYLRQEGVVLPMHYPEVSDSLDCITCTAHMREAGAERMRFIRAHYPEHWPEVKEAMRRVETEVAEQIREIWPAFNEVM